MGVVWTFLLSPVLSGRTGVTEELNSREKPAVPASCGVVGWCEGPG